MAEDKKKYKTMEPVLNDIFRCFISLSDEEKKRNNAILISLLELIVKEMKTIDSLFKEMYQRLFFGGSYYDGLRIGQPDEYDIDLLMKLPKLVKPTITTSNIPGYLHVQFKEYLNMLKQIDMAIRYKGLNKLMDSSQYLDTSEVLQWFESVVNLALNQFESKGNQKVLKIPSGVFYVSMFKSGPAFTLKVNGKIAGKDTAIDIDLVPCFVFGKEEWPVNGFRRNPVNTKSEFFIVPKLLKGSNKPNDRFWRLSFQEQERVIIDSKKALKPSVKLLKKMRDKEGHKCISSYYLKTVLLWQTEVQSSDFWDNSTSYVFMNVLKEYHKYLHSGKIPYFWYKSNNLIASLSKDTIMNISNRIKAIIEDIEKHPEDSYVVAKYLLTNEELIELKTKSLKL